MHLTIYSDYALRVLLYLKLRPERKVTIEEIARAYGISKNHLMKVVQNLARLGYVEASRGRGGGLSLAKAPETINLGAVVRQTEPNFNIAECFDPVTNTCPIISACDLARVLGEAGSAFLSALDKYTLGDLGKQKKRLEQLLGITDARPS